MKLSRRQFLSLSALGGSIGSGIAYGSTFTTSQFELEEVVVRSPALPSAFDDYRIAFVSDIHYGPFIPDEWVFEVVKLVKDAKPDLLLFGGDHINIPDTPVSRLFWITRNPTYEDLNRTDLSERIYKRLTEILADALPKDGAFTVFGNHDRWISAVDCKREFHNRGIRCLVNESAIIERDNARINVIGVDDYWSGIPDLGSMSLSNAPAENEYRILLSHNPDYLSHVYRLTRFSFHLGLCGHTHGGQIRLPLLGPISYNIQDSRFGAGLVEFEDTAIYTTRGVGVVEIPYRINCPPEVTVITLKRSEERISG